MPRKPASHRTTRSSSSNASAKSVGSTRRSSRSNSGTGSNPKRGSGRASRGRKNKGTKDIEEEKLMELEDPVNAQGEVEDNPEGKDNEQDMEQGDQRDGETGGGGGGGEGGDQETGEGDDEGEEAGKEKKEGEKGEKKDEEEEEKKGEEKKGEKKKGEEKKGEKKKGEEKKEDEGTIGSRRPKRTRKPRTGFAGGIIRSLSTFDVLMRSQGVDVTDIDRRFERSPKKRRKAKNEKSKNEAKGPEAGIEDGALDVDADTKAKGKKQGKTVKKENIPPHRKGTLPIGQKIEIYWEPAECWTRGEIVWVWTDDDPMTYAISCPHDVDGPLTYNLDDQDYRIIIESDEEDEEDADDRDYDIKAAPKEINDEKDEEIKPKRKRSRSKSPGRRSPGVRKRKGTGTRKARKPKSKKKKEVKPGRLAVIDLDEDEEKAVTRIKWSFESFHPSTVATEHGTRRTSLEGHRAVIIRDEGLMEKVFESKEVANPLLYWSCNNKEDCFDRAIRMNQVNMIKLIQAKLCDTKIKDLDRVLMPVNPLQKTDTGHVGEQFLGHSVRTVGAVRGGKQGNDAFVEDDVVVTRTDNERLKLVAEVGTWETLEAMCAKPEGAPENKQPPAMFGDDLCSSKKGAIKEAGRGLLYYAAESGNFEFVSKSIVKLHKKTGFGTNDMHPAVVAKEFKSLGTFKGVSVGKKLHEKNHGIGPIHLAALNPHTSKFLEEILESSSSASYIDHKDSKNRQPIHFAAVCAKPDNIKLLIKKGANPNAKAALPQVGWGRKRGKTVEIPEITPLRLACEHGFADNIPWLLGRTEEDDKKYKPSPEAQALVNEYISKKTKQMLIHVAAKKGHAKVITVLLDHGANVKAGYNGEDRKTPLHLASENGHLDACKALVEHKSLNGKRRHLIAKDKFKRIPLTLACKNGHFHVVKYLLLMGSPPDAPDSSSNYPAHYAAAYGWAGCLKLLLASGGNPQVFNIFKTTPLLLSMLKSHTTCSTLLLTTPQVDVNVVDSDGKTLLHHLISCKGIAPERCLRQVEYLVEKKSADASIKEEGTGKTPLHYLAATKPHAVDGNLAILLIKGKARPDDRSVDGETPLSKAVENQNDILVKAMLDEKTLGELKCGPLDANVAIFPDDDAKAKTSSRYTPLMLAMKLTVPPLPKRKKVDGKLGPLKPMKLHFREFAARQSGIVKAIVKQLVRQDGGPNNLDKKDRNGRTALMHAILAMSSVHSDKRTRGLREKNIKKIVKTLIFEGSDGDTLSNGGETALSIAISQGLNALKSIKVRRALIRILVKKSDVNLERKKLPESEDEEKSDKPPRILLPYLSLALKMNIPSNDPNLRYDLVMSLVGSGLDIEIQTLIAHKAARMGTPNGAPVSLAISGAISEVTSPTRFSPSNDRNQQASSARRILESLTRVVGFDKGFFSPINDCETPLQALIQVAKKEALSRIAALDKATTSCRSRHGKRDVRIFHQKLIRVVKRVLIDVKQLSLMLVDILKQSSGELEASPQLLRKAVREIQEPKIPEEVKDCKDLQDFQPLRRLLLTSMLSELKIKPDAASVQADPITPALNSGLSLDIVKNMVNKGLNVNIQGKSGGALQAAIKRGLNAVKIIVQSKACVNVGSGERGYGDPLAFALAKGVIRPAEGDEEGEASGNILEELLKQGPVDSLLQADYVVNMAPEDSISCYCPTSKGVLRVEAIQAYESDNGKMNMGNGIKTKTLKLVLFVRMNRPDASKYFLQNHPEGSVIDRLKSRVWREGAEMLCNWQWNLSSACDKIKDLRGMIENRVTVENSKRKSQRDLVARLKKEREKGNKVDKDIPEEEKKCKPDMPPDDLEIKHVIEWLIDLCACSTDKGLKELKPDRIKQILAQIQSFPETDGKLTASNIAWQAARYIFRERSTNVRRQKAMAKAIEELNKLRELHKDLKEFDGIINIPDADMPDFSRVEQEKKTGVKIFLKPTEFEYVVGLDIDRMNGEEDLDAEFTPEAFTFEMKSTGEVISPPGLDQKAMDVESEKVITGFGMSSTLPPPQPGSAGSTEYIFSWEDDSGGYTAYNDATQKELNRWNNMNKTSGEWTIQISPSHSVRYHFNLISMKQKNLRTEYTRKIRKVPKVSTLAATPTSLVPVVLEEPSILQEKVPVSRYQCPFRMIKKSKIPEGKVFHLTAFFIPKTNGNQVLQSERAIGLLRVLKTGLIERVDSQDTPLPVVAVNHPQPIPLFKAINSQRNGKEILSSTDAKGLTALMATLHYRPSDDHIVTWLLSNVGVDFKQITKKGGNNALHILMSRMRALRVLKASSLPGVHRVNLPVLLESFCRILPKQTIKSLVSGVNRYGCTPLLLGLRGFIHDKVKGKDVYAVVDRKATDQVKHDAKLKDEKTKKTIKAQKKAARLQFDMKHPIDPWEIDFEDSAFVELVSATWQVMPKSKPSASGFGSAGAPDAKEEPYEPLEGIDVSSKLAQKLIGTGRDGYPDCVYIPPSQDFHDIFGTKTRLVPAKPSRVPASKGGGDEKVVDDADDDKMDEEKEDKRVDDNAMEEDDDDDDDDEDDDEELLSKDKWPSRECILKVSFKYAGKIFHTTINQKGEKPKVRSGWGWNSHMEDNTTTEKHKGLRLPTTQAIFDTVKTLYVRRITKIQKPGGPDLTSLLNDAPDPHMVYLDIHRQMGASKPALGRFSIIEDPHNPILDVPPYTPDDIPFRVDSGPARVDSSTMEQLVKTRTSAVEILGQFIELTDVDVNQKVVEVKKEEESKPWLELTTSERRAKAISIVEAQSKSMMPWCPWMNPARVNVSKSPMERDTRLLHLAACSDDSSMLSLLLKHGAKADVRDSHQRTPLILSCQRSNILEGTKALLEAEASVNLVDKFGMSAFTHAVNFSGRHSDDEGRGYQIAFQVEALLLEYKANPANKDIYERVPLHYAFTPTPDSESGIMDLPNSDPIELVSDLCGIGAERLDLNKTDLFNRTPLHYAAAMGAQVCANWIIRDGAHTEIDDMYENSALQYSVLKKRMGLSIAFIDKGVKVVHPLTDPKLGEKMTTFRKVLSLGWMGVVYLMMKCGVEISTALADALACNKFQLVLTLLQKTKAEQIKALDSHGRNLLHVLASYSPRTIDARKAFEKHWSLRIADVLQGYNLDVNIIDRSKARFPLANAAENQHVNLARRFLSFDKSLINRKDKDGFAPIHLAARNGDLKMLEILINNKANVNLLAPGSKAIYPLHLILKPSRSVKKLADLLIMHGANINAKFGKDYPHGIVTVVHWAARYRKGQFLKLLIQHGADVTIKLSHTRYSHFNGECTALHVAVGHTRDYPDDAVELVRRLLDARANPNARYEYLPVKEKKLGDKDDAKRYDLEMFEVLRKTTVMCALHVAVLFRNERLARLLLDARAKVDTKIDEKLLVKASKFKSPHTSRIVPKPYLTALHFAVASSQVGIIRRLIEKKANPNIPFLKSIAEKQSNNKGELTVLHHSLDGIEKGRFYDQTILKLILKAGADPDAKMLRVNRPNADLTVLHSAVRAKNIALVKLLLEHLADPNIPLIEDNTQCGEATALHLAVNQGSSIKILKLLLQSRANPNALMHVRWANYGDVTPLHVVCRHEYTKKVELLLKFGADPDIFLQPKPESFVRWDYMRSVSISYASQFPRMSNGLWKEFSKELSAKLEKGWTLYSTLAKEFAEDEKKAREEQRNVNAQLACALEEANVCYLTLADTKFEYQFSTHMLKASITVDGRFGKEERKVLLTARRVTGKEDMHKAGGASLWMACRAKNHALVAMLTNFHSDPNLPDSKGLTVLMHAARENDLKMAVILMRGPVAYGDRSRRRIVRGINRRLGRDTDLSESEEKDQLRIPLDVKARARSLPKRFIRQDSGLSSKKPVMGKEILVSVTCQDDSGWTALHHAICSGGPPPMPSHENSKMIKLLVDPKFVPELELHDLLDKVKPVEFQDKSAGIFYSSDRKSNASRLKAIKDTNGRSAMFFALLQSSRTSAKALEKSGFKLLAVDHSAALAYDKELKKEQKAQDKEKMLSLYSKDLLGMKIDVKADQRKRLAEFVCDEDEDEKNKEAPEVDKNCTQNGKGHVLKAQDGVDGGGYYDLSMIATEVGYGQYGLHSFYRMQLVYNPKTDLTFLYNSWGRVGTDGSYQTSPYIKQQEAIDEFKKIFLKKTKNEWINRKRSTFVPRTKWMPKYPKRKRKRPEGAPELKEGEEENLVSSLEEVQRQVPQEQRPESKLPKKILSLISTIFDVAAMRQSRNKMSLDEIHLPMGEQSDEDLDAAYDLIHEIAVVVSKYEEANASAFTANQEAEKIEQAQRKARTAIERKERELQNTRQKLRNEKEGHERALKSGADAKEEPTTSLNSDFNMLFSGATNESKVGTTAEDRKAALEDIKTKLEELDGQQNDIDGEKKELEEKVDEEKELINENRAEADTQRERAKALESELEKMTNQFFTTLPIADFSKSAISAIKDKRTCNVYISKVSRLVQMQVAIGALMGAAYRALEVHPGDYCFKALGLNMILPLPKDSFEYEILFGYGKRSMHGLVKKKVKIFKIERSGSNERFLPHEKLRRMLLWHGSNVANFAGILTQGLRVAPPEADVTGYCFGKGIYFADQLAKSIGYAGHGNERNKKGIQLVLLAEVAIGKCSESLEGDWRMEAAPEGYQSTWGLGSQQPDPEHTRWFPNGLGIPDGPIVQSPKLPMKDGKPQEYLFGRNEFIVYDESQVKLRYLFMIGDDEDDAK